MCGISGFNWKDEVKIAEMVSCLSHRGPDADGIYVDDLVSLGHNRLSIIDLSESANQPMVDSSGELVIIFNGEIYNFLDIKKMLESEYQFKTKSDTEVILAAYKKWGKRMLDKLDGIFAFAIWDKKSQTLFCARDHMGVKPFYYYWDGRRFIFASELGSIMKHDILRILNIDGFNRYMRVLYSPEPETLLKDIYKLSPGSSLTIKGKDLRLDKYYEPKIIKRDWNYEEAVKVVCNTVHQSVEKQLVSDVPVGVYLSGGIDSSAVLASVARVKKNVKTFSIGFDLSEEEEQEKFNRDFILASETAKYFGADHHPLLISAKDVVESIEDIISSMDAPISNPTAIPMAHLSRFAKSKVSVVLSGNGGDELFGGYDRYRLSRTADVINSLHLGGFLYGRAGMLAKTSTLDRLALFEFEKDAKLKKVLSKTYFHDDQRVKLFFQKYISDNLSPTDGLMLADIYSWLPDQALLLGDKMSMLGSVEERVPFLGREVVDLAMSLPTGFKVSPLRNKRVLKDAFMKELPEVLFKEPKRGWFSPGAKWLRNSEFKKLAQSVLSADYYEGTKGLFDWPSVNVMLGRHVDKTEYNLTILWAILTFQIWAKKYRIKI